MVERGNSIIKLVDSADEYGEMTPFRKLTEVMVASVVDKSKWFSFGNSIDNRQVNIIKQKNNQGKAIGELLPEELFSLNGYRTKLYKYMILDYMCYCEIPTERNVEGTYKASFNKMIITSNVGVIANWLGITIEEAEKQYGMYARDVDDGEAMFPYVKLIKKDGVHKVTKPRTNLDLERKGIRIVPMYALKTGVDILYNKMLKGSYDVMFVKDGGQVRTMNTTSGREVVDKYYPDNKEFINMNWDKVYNGDFGMNPTIDRGYIRVFELGSSVYNNPTRSINFARIISFEEAEPDMTYMYIDLDSVLETFIKYLYNREWSQEEITELVESLDAFEVGATREFMGTRVGSVMNLENWANQQNMLMSTTFIRKLALCMIANPQFFDGYTGSPEVLSSIGTEDSGSAPEDLDWGF